jgi:hypothetical protein
VTGRAAAIQGGLAAVGLVAAYLTWQRSAELAPGAVTVIDASKSEVSRIHYEDDGSALDLWRDGGAKQVWVHLIEKKAKTPPTPPGKTPPKPEADSKPPPPRDLLGSEGALSLYEKFTPLVSPRAFGVLDASKLKELGLDPPKRTLVVTVKGTPREFQIGQPTGVGGGESFLRDTHDGRVYLMPRGVTPELQNGSHMVDRKLHTFDTGDYDRIQISINGKQKEYLHVGKESITTEGFAPPKTPDKRDQMAKNWHDSLMRLFPQDVLGKGENPEEGTPKTALRIDYFDGKKAVAWLEIAKVDTTAKVMSEDATPPAANQAPLYVRTEHTVGWLKVHAGLGSILSDAEKLVAQQ